MVTRTQIKAIWHKQSVISICIVVLGILIAFILLKSRKQPQRVEQENPAPLVKVKQLNMQDIQMVIRGYGTVRPKVQVEIVPQVSGKIVWVHPQFKAGGFIPAVEQILMIDRRDYELAVQQANAAVAEAQVMLDMEKAEAAVAREEWETLHPNTEPSSPLVLREPQIRQAQARLESAKAGLATANLNLERTQLSLPVDAVIVSEKVDLGQYVMIGQSIGVAYGIALLEIELPLEDRELAWFDIPDNMVSTNSNGSLTEGAVAQVKADFAGGLHTWKGYVVRTTGQVDTTSRLISVVIEVPEPFNSSDSKPPLLPGMFVEVLIEGDILKNAVAVPRDAIREGKTVWLVKGYQIHIQPLDIVRAEKDFAYVVSDLDDGVKVVVSSLDTVTEGMKVRVHQEAEEANEVGEEVIQVSSVRAD